MTIAQPATGDEVSGTINAGGDYDLRNARESYKGKITGSRSSRAQAVVAAGSAITSTARYTYTTAAGCTETYDASFVIDPGPPANPLDRISARVTCGPRSAASRRLAASGQRCTLKTTNTSRRALRGVSIALPNTTVSGVNASNGGACTSEGGFGICTWAFAFRPKQSRTVNLTTARLIKVGTGVLICVSGNTDFAGSYCVDAKVMAAASADLELELFASQVESTTRNIVVFIRVVVTNHGPDTSPSAMIRFSSNRRAAVFSQAVLNSERNMSRCDLNGLLWTCGVLGLARGETAFTTLRADFDEPGDFATLGTVTSALADPKPANNRDSARVRLKK